MQIKKFSLPYLKSPKITYSSIGGLGDKVSLVLVPLAVAAGMAVPMISSRSFKIQEKTLDKLESIPGLKTSFSLHKFNEQLLKVGGVMASLPEEITKPNRKNHRLRHSAALENSHALIQSFILSQALGVEGMVIDLKVGEGSSLKTLADARNFASFLKKVCDQMKIRSSFFLSNMDQPLGESVGNSLEVMEAIKVLRGNGPLDVLKIALEIGSEMLLLTKKSHIKTEAKMYLKRILEERKALEKFKEIIQAQGGNPLIVDNNSLLPQARVRKKVFSLKKGYIHRIKMKLLELIWNELAVDLSGKKIYPETGFSILKKIGDKIQKEEVLAEVHFNEISSFQLIQKKVREAVVILKNPPDFKPLIIEKT